MHRIHPFSGARRVLTAVVALAGLAPAAYAQDASAVAGMSWDQIKESARGQTVNWYMWGGSERINAYVSDYVGSIAQNEYGVTLRRVGINDTADAVNTVLSEVEAGKDEGSVDMIWINGENFRTLKQADLLFCGYLAKLPNNRHVNWDDPAVANDFGTPVDFCEVPWNKTQFAFGVDTARVADQPSSIPALLDWIRDNPGRFAYPAPPDFTGSVFVRHVFYHAAGGHERLLGPFSQQVFDEVAPKAWALLNEIEPHLWRQGSTYPNDINALQNLFSNQEVDFFFTYDASTFGNNVDKQIFPPTTRSFGLTDGTIGNTNFVAVPANSPHKAAAMVIANILLSPQAQYEKARPDVWGAAQAIDLETVDADVRAQFEALPRHEAVVSPAELARHSLPELQAGWLAAIEKGWLANVGR